MNLDEIFIADLKQFSTKYFEYLSEILRKINVNEIVAFEDALNKARLQGAKIFFVGNGGSASTASHFANDLAIGTRLTAKPFKAISLTDNTAIITAIGNDYGFQFVFSKQLEVLSDSGDILVLISASGNSPNLIEAVKVAKKKGIFVFALTSFDGGKLKELADSNIHVPANGGEYGPAEDGHLIINHLLASYLLRRHLHD